MYVISNHNIIYAPSMDEASLEPRLPFSKINSLGMEPGDEARMKLFAINFPLYRRAKCTL